jgi:glycosyltransferase involved in cell wall biosynthesis
MNKKRILLINSSHEPIAGAEVYIIALYKNLIKKGHTVFLLVTQHAPFQKELQKQHIPHQTYRKTVLFKKIKIQPGLRRTIQSICKTYNIQIIHCNAGREVIAAKKVAKKLSVKTVLTLHLDKVPKAKYMKNMDGIISVNADNTKRLQQINKEKKLHTKKIVYIPPFFENKTFETFQTTQNKITFFKKEFGIILQNSPLLCTIARLHKDKNITLLLKALHILIYKKNISVQLALAGDGPCKQHLKTLTKTLHLERYVYFLGNTDKVANILFHSDIKVLTSRKEGFGISLLEAALMKKPMIGATNTGMTNIIKHNQTGLLFKNNNLKSLIEQLEILLQNSNLGKQFGETAYKFINQEFSPEKLTTQMEAFYKTLS